MSIEFQNPFVLQKFRKKYQSNIPGVRKYTKSDTVVMTNVNGNADTKEIVEENNNGKYSRMEIDNGRIVYNNVPQKNVGFITDGPKSCRRIKRTLTPYYESTRKKRNIKHKSVATAKKRRRLL